MREAMEAFLSGDRERALDLAHPDIVSVRYAPIPDPQAYHGRAGVLRMWDDWTTEFEEFEMEAVEYVESSERVLVEAVQRARRRASGAPVGGRFWFGFTVKDGLITRMDAYLTREQALG